mgnify:CR=1 FL=1
MIMQKILRIDSNDNLIVALKDLHAGESFSWDDDNITLVTDVKAKHKFATQDIPLDGIVSMYGTPVGKATRPIVKGEAITVDNIRHYAAPVTLEDVEPTTGRHRMSLNGAPALLKVMSVTMAEWVLPVTG